MFFSGCTLQCRFCQNWQVSSAGMGAAISRADLAGIFLRLQSEGAENINIVTGTHFAPDIIGAYHDARVRGLSIPMVWNSSGYESLDMVRMLSPYVRFFLPDLKTMDPELSRRVFAAPDYPDTAAAAILAMAAALPLVWSDGTPLQGVIVRHLVLPGNLDDTRAVLTWFRDNLRGRALLSLMFQYTPIPGRALEPPFDRMIKHEEYETALGMIEDLSIEDGYVQEPETDGEWLPDFMMAKPFPSGQSKVVWHGLSSAR
jgi:putative pyruvate formate lyase activating enzyme